MDDGQVLKTLDRVSLSSCCSKLSPKQQIKRPKETNKKTETAILVLFTLETETAMATSMSQKNSTQRFNTTQQFFSFSLSKLGYDVQNSAPENFYFIWILSDRDKTRFKRVMVLNKPHLVTYETAELYLLYAFVILGHFGREDDVDRPASY